MTQEYVAKLIRCAFKVEISEAKCLKEILEGKK